jgi:hypothetical protein
MGIALSAQARTMPAGTVQRHHVAARHQAQDSAPLFPGQKVGVEEAAEDLGRIACHQPRERVEQEPIGLLLGQQGDRPAIELENGHALVIEGEIVETDLAAELGQHAPHRAHARHFCYSLLHGCRSSGQRACNEQDL